MFIFNEKSNHSEPVWMSVKAATAGVLCFFKNTYFEKHLRMAASESVPSKVKSPESNVTW